MSMPKALRQMPAPAGRAGVARGEAACEPASDEASGPRHEPNDTGNLHAALLHAAFTRENLQRALKRVRATQRCSGCRWAGHRPDRKTSDHRVACDPRAVVVRDVPAEPGTTGGDSQTGRWHRRGLRDSATSAEQIECSVQALGPLGAVESRLRHCLFPVISGAVAAISFQVSHRPP